MRVPNNIVLGRSKTNENQRYDESRLRAISFTFSLGSAKRFRQSYCQ